MANIYSDLLDASKRSRKANEDRYGQGLGIYDQIASLYAPGGSFGAGYEAQIERTKTRDVASGMQSLVSAGLSNTTTTAGLGKKFEEEVGQPARLKLEDLKTSRYTDALRGKAGFIERREDTGPSYSDLYQAGQGYGAGAARPRQKRPSYKLPETVGPSWLGFKR